ncbi:MAG: glucose-1-phosphate adenylyltransferase [Coraliomargarita sp. TMED73]|jgi:glucose-1-phosphate adenylyltransferase|nr:MAG: glucose-1-phosphate adenylyltransferase [Coraliomargarita sp. TMED73]|tara:strand:- start:4083 stop:5384 length:1302 start_codon:yes stop_codon:yes gene_type:complete
MKKRKIVCIIMGGGRGSRLVPLTRERCKPAVPLAGKYRLVDIPISNCLNSGYNEIYVLTQFNTASLHRHIQEAYKFDPFAGGCVDILSAEQTDKDGGWYQGTADAVRQNLNHFGTMHEGDLFIILSGDQLFRMDLADVVRSHDASRADVTLTAKPMGLDEAEGLGLMRVDDSLEITEFVEKPKDPAIIEGLSVGESVTRRMKDPGAGSYCLASMGIYVFNAEALSDALDSEYTDFGKEVIPNLLGQMKLCSYIFDDYWEDIGTVKAFFECNLRLTDPVPPFNFYNEDYRIFTRARYLPASKVNACTVDHAVMADGCIVTDAHLSRCSLGVRSVVNQGSLLDNVVMMGADFFETVDDFEENQSLGRPNIGVGKGCRIHNAILDKNVRIGDNVVLDPDGLPDNFGPDVEIAIRDGIVVVCKDTVVPEGFVLKAES